MMILFDQNIYENKLRKRNDDEGKKIKVFTHKLFYTKCNRDILGGLGHKMQGHINQKGWSLCNFNIDTLNLYTPNDSDIILIICKNCLSA